MQCSMLIGSYTVSYVSRRYMFKYSLKSKSDIILLRFKSKNVIFFMCKIDFSCQSIQSAVLLGQLN